MSVELQNSLFEYFSSSLQFIVSQAKKDGQWDMGILGKSNDVAILSKLMSYIPWIALQFIVER